MKVDVRREVEVTGIINTIINHEIHYGSIRLIVEV